MKSESRLGVGLEPILEMAGPGSATGNAEADRGEVHVIYTKTTLLTFVSCSI
jgi:hypothetical protein